MSGKYYAPVPGEHPVRDVGVHLHTCDECDMDWPCAHEHHWSESHDNRCLACQEASRRADAGED